MPGGYIRYTGPRYGSRRYSIRGRVTKKWATTSGWWIFKKTHYRIQICLDSEQLKIRAEKYGYEKQPPQLFDFGASVERFNEILVGDEIGVTFAEGGELEQFFNGCQSMAICDMKHPLAPGEQLHNELVGQQKVLPL